MRSFCKVGFGVVGLGLAGCPSADPPSDADPAAQAKRQLVEDVVEKLVDDALWVAVMSHDLERAYSLTLIGTEQGSRGIAFLIEDCTAPVEFDPYCEAANAPDDGEPQDPFWSTRDRCSRLGCEAAGVGFSDVYFTVQPRTDRDDRHRFSYEGQSPSGTFVYDPNPLVHWVIDQSDTSTRVAYAQIDQHVTFTASGAQESIDVSHEGRLEVFVTDNENGAGEVALTFPGIWASSVVSVLVAIAADGSVSGTVRAGTQDLADISGSTGAQIGFAWTTDAFE